jgi:hypothetical protein
MLVQRVFTQLDNARSGLVSVEDLRAAYDPLRHPEVLAKTKAAEDVLSEFLDTFDQHRALAVYARMSMK